MASAISAPPVPDLNTLMEFTRQLPETDGEPLETPWHRSAINLLIDILTFYWRDRNDFFVGGNMFLYYSLQMPQTVFKGPDFFFVEGVERHRPRESWIVWNEAGKYPDLIVELLSRTTAHTDRTTKKDLYERTFHTSEYFCFDPATNRLDGWRLVNGRYQDIPANERGWLRSERLGLWLGIWEGEYLGERATWLRFYDSSGNLVALHSEAAEAELARLRAMLAEQGISPEGA